jgi:hypothetical protein
MMVYGDPVPPPQQPQQQGQLPAGQGQYLDDYYYPGDMWQGKPSADHALQTREALYTSVDSLLDDDAAFETWISQRRLALRRASRIPGVDTKTLHALVRRFKLVVVRAHSEGKSKILRSMMENLDFELELLVSKADMPMSGLSGIGSMITSQTSQKQEIRMPQQQSPPGLFAGLASLWRK